MIEDIGFRSTKVRTTAGHLVSIPNANVVNSPIENISRRPGIRRNFAINLPPETPAEKVKQAVDDRAATCWKTRNSAIRSIRASTAKRACRKSRAAISSTIICCLRSPTGMPRRNRPISPALRKAEFADSGSLREGGHSDGGGKMKEAASRRAAAGKASRPMRSAPLAAFRPRRAASEQSRNGRGAAAQAQRRESRSERTAQPSGKSSGGAVSPADQSGVGSAAARGNRRRAEFALAVALRRRQDSRQRIARRFSRRFWPKFWISSRRIEPRRKPPPKQLGCTVSQLIKLLKQEPRAFQLVNQWREQNDLHRLQ